MCAGTISDTDAIARVADLLADAESFARAADFDAACVRARAAVRQATRVDERHREAWRARATLALAEHEKSRAEWQRENAERKADYVRRETRPGRG